MARTKPPASMGASSRAGLSTTSFFLVMFGALLLTIRPSSAIKTFVGARARAARAEIEAASSLAEVASSVASSFASEEKSDGAAAAAASEASAPAAAAASEASALEASEASASASASASAAASSASSASATASVAAAAAAGELRLPGLIASSSSSDDSSDTESASSASGERFRKSFQEKGAAASRKELKAALETYYDVSGHYGREEQRHCTALNPRLFVTDALDGAAAPEAEAMKNIVRELWDDKCRRGSPRHYCDCLRKVHPDGARSPW